MVLVGEVLAGHVAGEAAERNLADGIDAQKGNLRKVRIAAHLIVRYQTFASDDDALGRPGEFHVRDRSSNESAIPKAISLVNVDSCDIGIERGNRGQFLAGKRAIDELRRAVREGVGAE